MRVLISTAGSHGDVLPFVALGREFAARGHEVILYANPFFRSYTTDSEIRFVPISTVEKYFSLFGELSDGDPSRAFKRVAIEYAEICPEYYRAMKAAVIPSNTIAIGNSLLFSPRLERNRQRSLCNRSLGAVRFSVECEAAATGSKLDYFAHTISAKANGLVDA